MAKVIDPMKAEILVVNAHFMTGKEGGTLQAVACRQRVAEADRNETNGKTIKVSPHLFGKNVPLPGETVYVEHADVEIDTNSNYRTIRNGKVSINRNDCMPAPPHPAESVKQPTR